MEVYSISSQITKINRFELSITVLLPDDRKPIYITEFEKNSKRYSNIKMNYPAFLQLVWPREKDGSQNGYPYTDFILNLNYYNKSVFTSEFSHFLDSYNNDDMFYIENGKLKLYSSAVNKYNRVCRIGEKFVRFYPHVLMDMNGNLYEGGVLALEKESIYGELTFSEMCALYEAINNADIWLYARMLLNAIPSSPSHDNSEEEKVKKNDFWDV